MTLPVAKKPKGLSIIGLLQPHWKALSLALLAVAGETVTDLLEPWPLKIVLDYLLQSKRLPGWMSGVVGWMGPDKLAVLNFAVLAVAVIAVVGALSSYLEKYLTTSVGQWVMHDLRRTLYHHIHRLSLAEHDERRTGDLISRVTSDIDSIQDFVAIPLGKYIANNLEFGRRLKKPPLVFGVNYFLRDKAGKFVNAVRDKAVWVKWMELRVHGEAGAARVNRRIPGCC